MLRGLWFFGAGVLGVDVDGFLAFVGSEAGGGASGFSDVLFEGVVDGDVGGVFGGAVPCGDGGGEGEVFGLDFFGVSGGDEDDVGRGLASDVEPEVVAFCDFCGEIVVAGGCGAVEDSVASGGEELADGVPFVGAVFFGFALVLMVEPLSVFGDGSDGGDFGEGVGVSEV